MGVEPAHVGRLEGGTANPSLAVLVSVAHAFGLAAADLVAPQRSPAIPGADVRPARTSR